jgi:Arc/MetJ family transcription regulator
MNLRDQVMTALHGGRPDRVPFTCYEGLLPEGALEIDNLAIVGSVQPFRAETPGVEGSQREIKPGVHENRLDTPWGSLTQITEVEPGYGSQRTREHLIKSPADYEVMAEIVRHTRLTPDYDAVRAALDHVGDRGVVLQWGQRTPFQRVWIECSGIERMSLDLLDAHAAVENLIDAFFEQQREVFDIIAASPAEIVWLGDNVTGAIVGPPIFERHLAPYYRMACGALLPAGKLPVCHMDGMLRQIADCIARTELPVMEAFTAPPDGNFSVRDARERWPEKVLWLNFPSSVHLASPETVERVTRQLVAEAGTGEGFLMGITENMPADVALRSMRAIAYALR